MSVDIDDIETTRNDYRRANGAPQIVDREGKNQRFSRPSSYAKPLDDESALVAWKIDRACLGVASDRALQARWCAIDLDDADQKSDKTKLREASISAGRGAEAADIGTALHAMTVRFETDMNFSPPQPYLDSLQAYMDVLQRYGLTSQRFEYHVVNETYRCAGTADRLYRLSMPLTTPDNDLLPAGTLLVGDIKTGSKLEFSMPSYAVQTFLYAEGSFYDVVTDTFQETPPINQKWAVIIHMPAAEPGLCELRWVDLEVGAHGAYIVQMVKQWRKMWRSGEFDMPVVGLPDYDMAALLSDDEPVALDREPNHDGGYGLADYVEWFKLRLSYIAAHDKAKAHLLRLWPEGLPTLKQGIGDEHVKAIGDLLSQIEAEYTLGFVEGGPTSVGPRINHRKG